MFCRPPGTYAKGCFGYSDTSRNIASSCFWKTQTLTVLFFRTADKPEFHSYSPFDRIQELKTHVRVHRVRDRRDLYTRGQGYTGKGFVTLIGDPGIPKYSGRRGFWTLFERRKRYLRYQPGEQSVSIEIMAKPQKDRVLGVWKRFT